MRPCHPEGRSHEDRQEQGQKCLRDQAECAAVGIHEARAPAASAVVQARFPAGQDFDNEASTPRAQWKEQRRNQPPPEEARSHLSLDDVCEATGMGKVDDTPKTSISA